MSDFSKIEIIYQMIISNMKLNKYNLNLRRITDDDILELENKNIIKKIDNDLYQFVDVNGLYKYGIKWLEERQGSYAFICFSKAYELEPDNREYTLRYIIELIRKNNYDRAFEIFINMSSINDKKYSEENNLYLYLFGRLMLLNNEYVDKARSISCGDVLLYDSKENEIDNEIRRSIIHSKYTYACSLISNKLRKSSEYRVNDLLVKVLLNHIIDIDKKYKSDIVEYAKCEKYDLIIILLKEIEKQRNLSRLENSILILCEDILNIIKNNKIDCYEFAYTHDICNVHDAIIVKDYRLAKEVHKNFLEYKGENVNDDVLFILLSNINKLNEEMKKYDNKIEDIEEKKDSTLIEEDDFIDMDKIIKVSEEWAYYLTSLKIDIDKGIKRAGLFYKYALLVKLVLARDCYLNCDYVNGDRYLLEVEGKFVLDREVELFLEEVRNIRDNNKYTKRLLK